MMRSRHRDPFENTESLHEVNPLKHRTYVAIHPFAHETGRDLRIPALQVLPRTLIRQLELWVVRARIRFVDYIEGQLNQRIIITAPLHMLESMPTSK